MDLRQLHTDVNFDFIRELFQKVGLGSPQNKRLEDFVHLFDDLHFELLILIILVEVEPFFKIVFVSKKRWHQDIQKTPQFTDVVLQWGSCQQKSAV